MLDIKNYINNNINKELKIILDEGRSKKSLKIGKIIRTYENIFLIEIDERVLSFSYTDVLIKKINFVNAID